MGSEVRTDAGEALTGQEFLAGHGLEELSEMRLEAHGGNFTVAEAIDKCPPLAQMITGMAVGLEHVPDGKDILKKTITTMAAKTLEVTAPDAKKKLI